MPQTYLVLLRGVNVGGHSLIKMPDLVRSLQVAGFSAVRSYIQSGNVIVSSELTSETAIAKQVSATIETSFQLQVTVVVLAADRYCQIIEAAPADWGADPTWKHNLLVLLPPSDTAAALLEIGVLKPDIERLVAGDNVLYHSVSLAKFGRAITGKLASKAVYKCMTVRNYNTATKLAELLNEASHSVT